MELQVLSTRLRWQQVTGFELLATPMVRALTIEQPGAQSLTGKQLNWRAGALVGEDYVTSPT